MGAKQEIGIVLRKQPKKKAIAFALSIDSLGITVLIFDPMSCRPKPLLQPVSLSN